MRSILLSIAAALLFFVPIATAHTNLDTTNPKDGVTVTSELKEVSLSFSGNIEEGSTFTLTGENGTILKPSTVTTKSGVLTGTFDEALANDIYTVNWNSISADGHPMSGKFKFTVNVVGTTDADTTEQPTVDATNPEVDNVQNSSNSDEKSSSTTLIIAGILLIAILIISAITLVKRKKA